MKPRKWDYVREPEQLNVGDHVAYSLQFLAAIFQTHSDMAHARGTITELSPLSSQTMLATVQWENRPGLNVPWPGLPTRVNTFNLAKVIPTNPRFCKL